MLIHPFLRRIDEIERCRLFASGDQLGHSLKAVAQLRQDPEKSGRRKRSRNQSTSGVISA